jgi:hypothetical protein
VSSDPEEALEGSRRLTTSFTLFLPMLATSFSAMLVQILLRNPPIYDSLQLE